MRKKIYLGAGLIIALIAIFWYLGGNEETPKQTSSATGVSTETTEIAKQKPIKGTGEARIGSATAEMSAAAASPIPQISVKISAGSDSYSLNIPAGKNIYQAMEVLASENPKFSFDSKYFSSLGYQVNEINGKKESGGYYWTLYINGKYSNVGASSYILKNGDTVEWRYEKN